MTEAEKLNVEYLRKAGYKVRVYHCRWYCNPYESIMISKREFEAIYNDGRGLDLSSYGGYTKVEITTPDGVLMQGKFNVPSGKQFNRKLGLRAALGRAWKAGPFYVSYPATMADDDEIPF